MSIIIFNLNEGFLVWRQPCPPVGRTRPVASRLHDSNFRGDASASRTYSSRGERDTAVQCDFAERELASSRTTDLPRSLISAAVASGEVAASGELGASGK
jgi:hypothetical protein